MKWSFKIIITYVFLLVKFNYLKTDFSNSSNVNGTITNQIDPNNNNNNNNNNLNNNYNNDLNDDDEMKKYTLYLCKQPTKQCNSMPYSCLDCSIDNNRGSAKCTYGETIQTNCTIKNITDCSGDKSFNLSFTCRFCYQTPDWLHICTPNTTCRRDSWNKMYKANCTVSENAVCLGSRTFYKNLQCDWTSGYKWNTAMILSIFFGGFGIDRFYLGQYKEGLGKLFSFGGLGVWSLVDVVLLYTGYIGPSDGSLFI